MDIQTPQTAVLKHPIFNSVSTSFLGSSNKIFMCTRRDKTLRESDIRGALCESELEKCTI